MPDRPGHAAVLTVLINAEAHLLHQVGFLDSDSPTPAYSRLLYRFGARRPNTGFGGLIANPEPQEPLTHGVQ